MKSIFVRVDDDNDAKLKVGDDVCCWRGNEPIVGTIIAIEDSHAKVYTIPDKETIKVGLDVLTRCTVEQFHIEDNDEHEDDKEVAKKSVEEQESDGTAKDATHYQRASMQPIEVMQRFLTKREFIGFLKGNIIKYKARAAFKGDRHKDLQKARQYAYWLALAECGVNILAEHDSVPEDFKMRTTFDIEHNYSDAQLIKGNKE